MQYLYYCTVILVQVFKFQKSLAAGLLYAKAVCWISGVNQLNVHDLSSVPHFNGNWIKGSYVRAINYLISGIREKHSLSK